ncbi:helix-turn-helix domain-containing protein [bacterium]|nr:helix-turn-helix domain-containing protein [bacterium]
MEENHERPSLFLVKDLETLKVLTDPLRIQILELLDATPQTVNYVAEKLGLASSRLYYHFNLLESIGLITVAKTRTVNNIIEKYYWVTADEVEIDKNLMLYSSEDGTENIGRVVSATLDATRDDVLRTLQARRYNLDHGAAEKDKSMVATRMKKRLDESTYNAFFTKFQQLIKEFEALEEITEEVDDSAVLSMTCLLYPSYYFAEEGEEKDDDNDK